MKANSVMGSGSLKPVDEFRVVSSLVPDISEVAVVVLDYGELVIGFANKY